MAWRSHDRLDVADGLLHRYGVVGVFWLGTYMALLDQGWLWWVTSVGAVPAALTGFAVGSLALFPGLPAAPFYTLAHFKCHTTKHKSKSA